MVDADTDCRCMGVDRRTRCEREATQEDGSCDGCRCEHGVCSDHGDDEAWSPMLFFDDPVEWMHWFQQAVMEAELCRLTPVPMTRD